MRLRHWRTGREHDHEGSDAVCGGDGLALLLECGEVREHCCSELLSFDRGTSSAFQLDDEPLDRPSFRDGDTVGLVMCEAQQQLRHLLLCLRRATAYKVHQAGRDRELRRGRVEGERRESTRRLLLHL